MPEMSKQEAHPATLGIRGAREERRGSFHVRGAVRILRRSSRTGFLLARRLTVYAFPFDSSEYDGALFPVPGTTTRVRRGILMTKMGLTAVVLLLIAGSAVSIAQKSNPNDDEQAIRKLDKDWSAAAQSKDVDKTVSFYSDDASALPFNAPIATGKEAIRQVWAHLTSLPGFALTFGPTKIEVAKSGDLAYDVGTFELKSNDAQKLTGPFARHQSCRGQEVRPINKFDAHLEQGQV